MSGESLEDNEVADSAVAQKIKADSATSNEDKSMSNAELGSNLLILNEFKGGKTGETIGNTLGGEKTLTGDNGGEHTTQSDLNLNGDYMVKLHQNISEDEDDEDDDLWEDDDSEEDDEDTAIDQDEASADEETDGEDDEGDSEGDDEEIALVEGEVSKKGSIEDENKKENVEVENKIVNKDKEKAGKLVAKLKVNESKGTRGKDGVTDKLEAKLKVNESKGKRGKDEVREESSKKHNMTEKSKSKSLTMRKGNKRVESMGMIFMCSSDTKHDCFKYMVLGQSEGKKKLVEKIYPGMRLFLYDVDLRLMYGIFKARERGGYNIEPKAFNSKFPSQVRFTVLVDCLPLPEERFREAIKENYFTKKKFDCQLNSEQVNKLCKLFKSTSKGQQTKKLPRSRKLEKRPIPTRPEGSRKRRAEDERRLPERKEIRYAERPRKRPRKDLSPIARSRHPLPPSGPLTVDRNLDVDPYKRDPYVERRSRDPYEIRRDRPVERRDPYLEHSREPYHDGRDQDRRDHYRNVRDPQLDYRGLYADTRDSYPDRRISYRDELDLYPDHVYKDERVAYTERPVYITDPYSRDLLPARSDVYRGEDVYRSSYRSQGVLDQPLSLESRRRYEVVNQGVLDQPLNLESRRRYEVVSQDPYAPYRGLPSNAEPLYFSQFPPRTYRL